MWFPVRPPTASGGSLSYPLKTAKSLLIGTSIFCQESPIAPISFEIWYAQNPPRGGEANSLAKLHGFAYDATLIKAYSGDSAALLEFLMATSTIPFDGASGELHNANLKILLAAFGDIGFSKALSQIPTEKRDSYRHLFWLFAVLSG